MKHLGDITKINGAEIEPVHCIIGGSPCQDLSIAGKRAGLSGERSGLFMEQVRIVKEMREKYGTAYPRFMVWENVTGAFSSNKGADFAAVLTEIIRIAEPEAPDIEVPEKGWPTWGGYHDEVGGRWSVVWRTHDAQYWGVPQRRRRISVVADFGGDTASEIQFDPKSVSGDIAESGAAWERPTGASESGAGRTGESLANAYGETGVGYWQNGVQTLRAEGENRPSRPSNVVVCSAGNDQTIFCLATQQGGAELRTDDRTPTLTAAAGMSGNNQPVVAYGISAFESNAMKSSNPHSGVYEADTSRTLDGNGGNPACNQGGIAVLYLNDQGGNVMGVSHDVSGTLREQEHGHQPSILDMSHACDIIRDCGKVSPSLQARMGTGGNQVPLTYQAVTGTLSPGAHAGGYNGQDAYNDMLVCGATPDVAHALRAKAACAYREDAETYPVQNMMVRRLTPLECTRLQGYPDGWVDIGDWTDEKGKKHKDADSPKYKALGNSIALPFWDWMLRRMARYLPEGATLGSLFDGIGGFPLIWERIHGRGTARWASEIEAFPIAVTKKHFPETVGRR